MKIPEIKKSIEKILDNNKAKNITSINLKNKSYIADYMIILRSRKYVVRRNT